MQTEISSEAQFPTWVDRRAQEVAVRCRCRGIAPLGGDDKTTLDRGREPSIERWSKERK